jgi:peptidoglycan/LPS O-acetylase OafA/YrhL
MENKLVNIRIDILDGFRAIAILMVVSYHYFSGWVALYSYGYKYDFFTYGKMGVPFFFMISGFVILYTLENTNGFIEFWKKRIIRLFPAMLVASVITYLFCSFFDTEFVFPASHVFTNILVSITFIDPNCLSALFGNEVKLNYISGSYWSLWPEIQFYLVASVIYFLNKKKFQLFFLGLTFILFSTNFLLHHLYIDNSFLRAIRRFFADFDFLESLPYFCFGVLFYTIYKNKMLNRDTSIFLKIYFIGLLLFQIDINRSQPSGILVIFIFLILFGALIYFSKIISFLENPNLLKIGISSYFLYLIHENIGVLIISKYGVFFKGFEFVVYIAVIVLMIVVSVFYTYIIDNKLNKFLKNRLLMRE